MKHEIASKIERQLREVFGPSRVKSLAQGAQEYTVRAHVPELTGTQMRQVGAISATPGTEFLAKRSGTGITLIFT